MNVLKLRKENGEEISPNQTRPLTFSKGSQLKSLLMMDYMERLSSALEQHTPQIFLDERIGKGGFCSVYQGYYLDGEGEKVYCAIKMQTPDFSAQRTKEQANLEEILFLNECLLHPIIHRLAPNVVKPHFFGAAGTNHEFPFMVMQLMQDYTGASIASMPEKYHLQDRINIIRDIARCLFYMHRNGYLHCDIKPENILFPFPDESSDRLLRGFMGDFGLARSVKSTGSVYANELLGSPNFMAPEQVTDRHADKKSDQFSLGAVLYLFLSGQLPRDVQDGIDNPYEKALAIAQAPIVTNPSGIYSEERGFLPIALKALERDPDKRFESIAEMDYALKQVFHNCFDNLAPPRRKKGLLHRFISRTKSILGCREPFLLQ